MSEHSIDILEKIILYGASGALIIAVITGIVMRIVQRKRYGPEKESSGPVIQPMPFYGAMPTSGEFCKPDFSYDEKQELEAEKYDKSTGKLSGQKDI